MEFEKSNVERVVMSNKYCDWMVKGRENPVVSLRGKSD